jgi:regulator of protease activity HflC (stomatin/prohibitin superfamily)
MTGRVAVGRTIAAIAGVAIVIGLLALAVSCGTVPQSEVGFVVGGGPFDPDRKKVKSDLLEPGRHITGTWDGVWTFPSNRTLRFHDVSVAVTTIDGKKVQLTTQVGFRFVGERDPALAREFAEGLGARKYGGKRPGDGGGEGWRNFLVQLVEPEIVAAAKEAFGRVYCADFEPSCRAIDPRRDVPAAEPEQVYSTVSGTLQERIDRKLGASFLRDVTLRVKRISLPDEVQVNIDRVTAEQARTKAAEQSVQTARAEADAIRTKARALRENRDLIALEVAKECRGGSQCTIVVDAAGGGVDASVPAGGR